VNQDLPPYGGRDEEEHAGDRWARDEKEPEGEWDWNAPVSTNVSAILDGDALC
jgi:hypothetical protein